MSDTATADTATSDTVGLYDCRDTFAATLLALAEADPRVAVVVNDSVGSSKRGGFQQKFPDRIANLGIAEPVVVGVAAGLANGGKVPFVSAASCFLTGRALEQITADITHSNVNAKLTGQSSGVACGDLGPSQHSIEDFAGLRPLTKLTVICPADPWQVEPALIWAAGHDGPVDIRPSRSGVPALRVPGQVFAPEKAELLQDGSDLTLIACGTMVHLAVAAADLLASDGISARVLNHASTTPLDATGIADRARKVLARKVLGRKV